MILDMNPMDLSNRNSTSPICISIFNHFSLEYTTVIFHDKTPHGKGLVYTLRISDVSTDDNGHYACESEEFARSAQMVNINPSKDAHSHCLKLKSILGEGLFSLAAKNDFHLIPLLCLVCMAYFVVVV